MNYRIRIEYEDESVEFGLRNIISPQDAMEKAREKAKEIFPQWDEKTSCVLPVHKKIEVHEGLVL